VARFLRGISDSVTVQVETSSNSSGSTPMPDRQQRSANAMPSRRGCHLPVTATCNDQHQLKSTLAQTEPSTHDKTL
jgi:hypothetical protein